MARNDLILIDQIVRDLSKTNSTDIGHVFQDFAVQQLLKDRDLSIDEFTFGFVDGRDDGGIDAWYTFLDGELVTDTVGLTAKRTSASLDVNILSVKHHDTFKQDPVVNLYAAVVDLLDFTTEDATLEKRYNTPLLDARRLLRAALTRSARSNPRLAVRLWYVSRGDTGNIGASIKARSDALVASVHELFSNCEASFEYVGSAELLRCFRRIKDFSSRIVFQEGPIARGPTNYIGLATLSSFHRFVADQSGELRRYLFESNVRDYMGSNPVNDAIVETLRSKKSSSVEDFWWLNNGVTVIASDATVIGKELHLENVQIVNGLQTTEAIYAYGAGGHSAKDDRCVLVKVLVTNSKALADRIILATNHQNQVDTASLRATDDIQRNIEDLLLANGWYYDRRKNFYSNQGKPQDRIVSIAYMSSAIFAARLGEPHRANRLRMKYLYSDENYHKLFDSRCDIRVFGAVLKISKTVEESMLRLNLRAGSYGNRAFTTLFRFLYVRGYVIAASKKKHPTDSELMLIGETPFDDRSLAGVHRIVCDQMAIFSRRKQRRLHRNHPFSQAVVSEVLKRLAPKAV